MQYGNHYAWESQTPERYEIDDQDDGTTPHDPPEDEDDEMDSDLDTPLEPTPLLVPDCSPERIEEDYREHREEDYREHHEREDAEVDRLMSLAAQYDRAVRVVRAGDYL